MIVMAEHVNKARFLALRSVLHNEVDHQLIQQRRERPCRHRLNLKTQVRLLQRPILRNDISQDQIISRGKHFGVL